MPRKPKLQIVSKDGRGRPREPLEAREAKSDYPHKDHPAAKDVKAKDANKKPIRTPSPFPPDSFETECWDDIIRTQSNKDEGAWIYESDYQYLYAHCILWGRLRTQKEQLDAYIAENGGVFDGEKVHPLVAEERRTNDAFRASLLKLGMVPNRRMIIEIDDEDDDDMLGISI